MEFSLEKHINYDLRQNFIRSIIESPEDDVVRLVFSDWLKDNGEEYYGDFIRVQIDLAEIDPKQPCGGYYCDWDANPDDAGDGYWRHVDCRGEKLRRRERELLGGKSYEWFFHRGQLADECQWHYRRGFVEQIECSTADWLRSGPALVMATPLTNVVLSDREPWQYPDPYTPPFWRWFDGGRGEELDSTDLDELPTVLWQAYTAVRKNLAWEHRDRQDALDALSLACLAWARELAGLPPLVL